MDKFILSLKNKKEIVYGTRVREACRVTGKVSSCATAPYVRLSRKTGKVLNVFQTTEAYYKWLGIK